MASGVFVPKVPDAKDILLGEGAIYYNYTISGTTYPMGATQGGSKFNIEKKIINPKVDGAYGFIKGIQRVEIFKPSLTVAFLRINYVNLGYGVPSTVTDQGDYHEFTFDLNFESTDVMTDITFVGQKHSGELCKITIFNALNVGDIDLDFKEKGEVTNEMLYEGHYDADDYTVPPFEYFEYETA